MYTIEVNLSDDTQVQINIKRPELIYGATAIMLKEEKGKDVYAINPVTKERMYILNGDENKFIIPLHNRKDYELAIKNKLPKKLAVMPYFTGEKESKIKEGVQTARRHSVIVIIKNPKTGEYLCEDAQNGKYRSFVQGGIEEGETIKQAALREVMEETGYKDINIKRISEIAVINHFFAAYKGNSGTNRFAKLEIVFGEINSLEKAKVSEEERKKHIVKWIPEQELETFININHNQFALNMFMQDVNTFEGEGIMNTNDENNEKKSQEARNVIINRYCKH